MKETKFKTCSVCRKKFRLYRTTQKVCSWECALNDAKRMTQKKEEQKKSLEQRRQFMKLNKNLRWSIEATTQVVHEFIRKRDKGKRCVSCSRTWDSSFQAGHFFKAELYSALKFDIENIHGQCQHCNLRKEGNLNEYQENLKERIGIEAFESLCRRASEYKKGNFKWNKEDLAQIRKTIKLKLKQIN